MRFWTKLFDLLQANIFGPSGPQLAIDRAVKDGDLEKVKALLKGNPDLVFNGDGRGWTPVHYAAHWGQKEVAELLLANKADVNAQDNYGMTPLHCAVAQGYKDLAELLLANKADVNAQDNEGVTPLHF